LRRDRVELAEDPFGHGLETPPLRGQLDERRAPVVLVRPPCDQPVALVRLINLDFDAEGRLVGIEFVSGDVIPRVVIDTAPPPSGI
jgi:hypothetical protein